MSLTILKFEASWCAPCRQLSKVINDIKIEFPNLNVKEIDIDEHIELTSEYGIMSVPTLIFLNNGEILEKIVGSRSKEVLKELISKHT